MQSVTGQPGDEFTPRGGPAAPIAERVANLQHELRALARRRLATEPPELGLRPSDLVQEVWLRLNDRRPGTLASDRELVAAAVLEMRRVIIDHARALRADKRGGDRRRLDLHSDILGDERGPSRVVDALAVEEALEGLRRLKPETAELVELRFYAGLSNDEAATLLERSPRWCTGEWRFARAVLGSRLGLVATPAPGAPGRAAPDSAGADDPHA